MKKRGLAMGLMVCMLAGAMGGCAGKPAKEAGTSAKQEEQKTEENSKEAAGKTEAPEGQNGQYGGVLTAYFTSYPTTCFLPSSPRAGDRVALQPAIEQLGRTRMDGSVEPFLAEAFETDADNLTFTIKIRDGITFHDGSVLNSEVVKWNIDKYIESGKGTEVGNPVSVEAVDDKTVVLTYDHFDNSWEQSVGILTMTSKQSYEEKGEDYMATHAVGTGPFVMTDFSVDSTISYQKNENYWQEGLPYLDGVECVFIQENTTLVSAFLNGEVDEIQSSEAVVIDQVKAAGFENYTAPSANNYSTTFCVPNTSDEASPWADDKVRTAVFHHGIDWNGVANILTNGLGSATTQWGVTGALNFDDNITRGEYNKDKALELLAEAGYPNGFSTVLWTGNSTEARDRATVLQSALKELGIEASVELYDDAVLGQKRVENTPGVYITEGPSALDMSTYMRNNFTPTASKYQKIIKYSDAYLEAMDQVFQAKTLEEKGEWLKQASAALFVEENKVITMSVLPAYCFVQDYVHDMGIRQATAYEWTPEKVWLSK